MSSYTMRLKEYIELLTDDGSISTVDRIENGRKLLFDFEYPIFDQNYKKIFETHFIRHFYMREIGFETEGLFKFHLETWLSIHMPYFNKLFESELIKFDPLLNSKVDVTHNKTTESIGSSESNGTSNGTSFDRQLESNTPDSRLTITTEDGKGVIEYASKIDEATSKADNTSHATSNGTANETEDYIQSRVGKIGVQSYSKMIMEYRQSFIRIEKQIFEEMQNLFMLVY